MFFVRIRRKFLNYAMLLSFLLRFLLRIYAIERVDVGLLALID